MVERGDIYYADLNPVTGSEQGGTRPVLVIQNDMGNRFSPTVIVAAITSNIGKARLPTHIVIEEGALSEKSVVLLEQIRTIDKTRLIKKLGYSLRRPMYRFVQAKQEGVEEFRTTLKKTSDGFEKQK